MGEQPAVAVVDLRGTAEPRAADRAGREIAAACRELGTFHVVGHGIAPVLIEQVRTVSGAFFDRPDADKARYASPSGNSFRGWAPTEVDGPEGPVRIHEQFQVSRFDRPQDLRAAGYSARWANRAEANRWPRTPPEFEATWKRYFAAMERLGRHLLGLAARGLGLSPDWFGHAFRRPASYLACNRYEARSSDAVGELALEPHTDIGTLTVLHHDDGPGRLQIRDREGRWRDVAARPGALVVNVGDLLAMWTDQRWVATEHRVTSPPPGDRRRRTSIAYFQNPDLDATIDCIPTCAPPRTPRPAPVVAGEWARRRMEAYQRS